MNEDMLWSRIGPFRRKAIGPPGYVRVWINEDKRREEWTRRERERGRERNAVFSPAYIRYVSLTSLQFIISFDVATVSTQAMSYYHALNFAWGEHWNRQREEREKIHKWVGYTHTHVEGT